MRFFGFSKYLHEHSPSVKKISLHVIFLPISSILNNYTANRLRRSGKAMSPPAAGVATRRFAHFLTSPERSVSRVQRHSTAKKNSRPTRHLLFIPRRKLKGISTGLRHKPQMPRFPSWVFFVRCAFWRARDWHRPAPEKRKMKKEYCFIMNIFTLSLPPSPKKSGGEEGKTFVKE